MQCLSVAKFAEGLNWEYEVKFDGYRAFGIKSGGVGLVTTRCVGGPSVLPVRMRSELPTSNWVRLYRLHRSDGGLSRANAHSAPPESADKTHRCATGAQSRAEMNRYI
jgi:hypothetical protein